MQRLKREHEIYVVINFKSVIFKHFNEVDLVSWFKLMEYTVCLSFFYIWKVFSSKDQFFFDQLLIQTGGEFYQRTITNSQRFHIKNLYSLFKSNF